MPQKTLSWKGTMAEALWNSDNIWNPKFPREKKKKQELCHGLMNWKENTGTNKICVPPKIPKLR